MLEKLRARFDPRLIRTRRQGGVELQYVDIASTIERFLDVLGLDWDWEITSSKLVPLADGQYLATVTGEIEVRVEEGVDDVKYVRRAGAGADVAKDADKAYKTALAEAFKKAGHYFGVGLELWDEGVRAQNETVLRAVGSDDLNELKAGVFQLALANGAKPNAASVAKYFNVDPDALQNADTLKEILGRAA